MIEKYARQLSIWLIQNGGDSAKKTYMHTELNV